MEGTRRQVNQVNQVGHVERSSEERRTSSRHFQNFSATNQQGTKLVGVTESTCGDLHFEPAFTRKFLTMDAASQLPEHLKGEFFQILEELQVGDTLSLYNKITDTCFQQCVNTFHSKKLDGSENRCLNTCVFKFMKMSQRIGQRYQEHQLQQSQLGMSQYATQTTPSS